MSELAVDHVWLFGDDTGISSKAIWKTMYGIDVGGRWGFGHPHDPADLGRCIRLLRRHPEWVPRMGEMAQHGKVWTALVDRWAELVASYESEEPHKGARNGWSAPETYKLMRSIIDPPEEE